jgi:hypothetical protein
MKKSLMTFARRLWTTSPQDYWQYLTDRRSPNYSWRSPKLRYWTYLPYYLQLFERCAGLAGVRLDWLRANVLEIGAGPNLGFIPFVILNGSTTCTISEPRYREVRHLREFTNNYLFELYSQHSCYLGRSTINFDCFASQIECTKVIPTRIEDASPPGHPYSIVLSKSCLDHVIDIHRFVDVTHGSSLPGSLHLHWLDFTSNQDRECGTPFGKLYEHAKADSPEYNTSPEKGFLNLLRASEVIEAFRTRFEAVCFYPTVDFAGRISLDSVHADWAKYPESDLSIAAGVLVAVR